MVDRSAQLDQAVAEEIHAELMRSFGMETEAWATERLDRVMSRLNAARSGRSPLTAHVLWIRNFTAFTTPAPRVYVGRMLLERLPTDEAVAFVLAHEAAHHDCGHLDLFAGWLEMMPRGKTAVIAASVFRHLEHRLYGAEREAEADKYALDLCLRAKYDGDKCIQAFEVLEQGALDRGDVDGVFGPENLLDPTDPGQGGTAFAIQKWIWTRAQRYLPLRERRELASAWLRRPDIRG
jgi:predicted Zn-dependent protease